MTSSGGTGRPTTDQDARKQNPSTPPESASGSASNGAPPKAPAKASGPIANEVTAALRAQEERERRQPPKPNGKPASPVGGPPPAAPTPPRANPDPVVDARRQAGNSTAQRRGAAAAREATNATRTRQDTTPRTGPGGSPNPWAQQAKTSEQQKAASPDTSREAARPTTSREVAPPPQPAPRPAPVPPPSLVAKQRNEATASSVGAVQTPAPPGSRPPAPGAPPAASAAQAVPIDTQASMEAVPRAETPKPQPVRAPAARRIARVRKSRLRLLRVDPWSVMKTAFLLSVALGITLFVAVAVLWSVLDAAGVFDSVNGIVTDMTASDTTAGIEVNQYFELSRVLGFTTLIAVVDVILLTALATLAAFLYNVAASLVGGLELTLAEDD